MFAFFGVYWSLYGWPLALGLVVSIYIHEMGHVAMLRRLGIAAGAPLFIPGVGALVMLKQHIDDPITDAKIGLAGPVWGLGAALAALGVYAVDGTPIWLAIAQLTGFLNLFNLIPVWQLDGSRGFHALSRMERWIVVAAIAAALCADGAATAVHRWRRRGLARGAAGSRPGRPARARHVRGARGGAVVDREGGGLIGLIFADAQVTGCDPGVAHSRQRAGREHADQRRPRRQRSRDRVVHGSSVRARTGRSWSPRTPPFQAALALGRTARSRRRW